MDKFLEKKKAESKFISLSDGESVEIKEVKAIKTLTKTDYAGEEIESLRLVCEVVTSEGSREKYFDNGTKRFVQQLVDDGIKVGSSFTLKREGEKTETRYLITNVVNK